MRVALYFLAAIFEKKKMWVESWAEKVLSYSLNSYIIFGMMVQSGDRRSD
jgi:hypothetical protein